MGVGQAISQIGGAKFLAMITCATAVIIALRFTAQDDVQAQTAAEQTAAAQMRLAVVFMTANSKRIPNDVFGAIVVIARP